MKIIQLYHKKSGYVITILFGFFFLYLSSKQTRLCLQRAGAEKLGTL